MGKIDFWKDCCLVLSILGFIFFFYITLICLFSPDRLHILHHKDHDADADLYSTAWSTSATCTFLYLLIASGLFFIKFNNQEDRQKLRAWFRGEKIEMKLGNPYEMSEFKKYSKSNL
jgi:hypothetical protein